MPSPPKIRWYDNPLPWLGLQIVEVVVVSNVVRLGLSTWSMQARWAVWATLLAGALVANYVFLRKLRARDETP